MGIVFKKLADVVSDGKIRTLTYGFPKAGKTTLFATVPGRGLIINAEDGLLSLRRQIESGNVRGTISVADVGTLDDVRDVYAQARDLVASGEIEWIGIDSISEIAEFVLSEEKAKAKQKALEKRREYDPRKTYGELFDGVDATVKAFRDVGCDVHMLCKAEHWRPDEDSPSKIRPMLPGSKLGGAMPYIVDEVFYLSVVKGDDGEPMRVIQTAAGPKVDAGDRSGKLDPLEPADLGHILAKIRG